MSDKKTKETMTKIGKTVVVEVESVVSLTDEQLSGMREQLADILETQNFMIQLKVNPDLIGGVSMRVNSLLIDASVKGRLSAFQKEVENEFSGEMTPAKLTDFFVQKVESFDDKPIVKEVGQVQSVSDGVAKVSGLKEIASGERVVFEGHQHGLVLNLNPDSVDVVIFDDAENIREGQKVFRTNEMNSVPVGMELLGRVINPLGEPLDDRENLDSLPKMPVNAPAPGIVDRYKVCRPIQTGIKGIDSLVPIGRGQRELIIGDRQTGKTAIILDTILSQKAINDATENPKEKLYCIYVAIGQKQSTVRDIMRVLQEKGAMEYTTIVCATAADSASLQYLAPYAGCTIGEYFRDNGMNAIVFYDDLSKHAVAYREMSLLLKRPAGREAYPGDVFYLHSRLLERAAQLNEEKGGGSLTALPVVETQEGDVSAYIPTNVISITDGQIFLESALFHQGVKPAINVGLSVSRVGSSAQTKAMKKVAGTLKLDLAQYREVLSFSQFASDLDPATQALLNRGSRLTEMMKQKQYMPLTMAQEVVSIFAGVNGYLDKVDVKDISKYEAELQEKIKIEGAEIIGEIEKTKDLSEDNKERLHAFIKKFTDEFVGVKSEEEE